MDYLNNVEERNLLASAGYKRCSRCKLVKAFNEYYKNSQKGLGIRSECKECKSPVDAEYSKKNSAQRTETARLWRLKYPARQRQFVREYYHRKRELV